MLSSIEIHEASELRRSDMSNHSLLLSKEEDLGEAYHHSSTIFPICSLLSIKACALAASSTLKVL